MDIKEHLLVCIMEEAAEIQQAAAKALRFGLNDGYPCADTTNIEDLAHEITDLLAVVNLCEQYGIDFPEIGNPDDMADKQDRVNKMMGYAQDKGTLLKDKGKPEPTKKPGPGTNRRWS